MTAPGAPPGDTDAPLLSAAWYGFTPSEVQLLEAFHERLAVSPFAEEARASLEVSVVGRKSAAGEGEEGSDAAPAGGGGGGGRGGVIVPRERAVACLQAWADEEDLTSDGTLIRFIRARKHVLDDAWDMYVQFRAWYDDYQVRDILGADPSVQQGLALLRQVVPQRQYGHDRQGRPVFYHRTGAMHVESIDRFSNYMMQVCHVWQQENCVRACRRSSAQRGECVSTYVLVFDLAGLGMGHRATLRFMKWTSAIDKKFYPETLSRMVMINAPTVAAFFWKLVAPLMDPVTREKVVILGGPDSYREQLANIIDPAEIPLEYGGTCEDEFLPPMDDAQIERVQQMFDAEAEYTSPALEEPVPFPYFADIMPLPENLVELTVAAGTVEHVDVVVPEGADAATRVEYFWQIASKDVDFTVSFVPAGGGEPIVLREKRRYDDTHILPARALLCIPDAHREQGGTMRLSWDNSYSRWTSKYVTFVLRTTTQGLASKYAGSRAAQVLADKFA